jgi:hypothetical protein
MTECPNCHAILPQPPERFCPNCGTDLGAALPGGFAPPPAYGQPPGYSDPGFPPPPGYPPSGGGYLPPGGSPPGGGTPWERRDQIGFVSALIETTREVLTAPTAFFRAMPILGGIPSPLLYGLIVSYVGLVASTIYSAVFRSVLGSSLTQLGANTGMERLAPLLQGGASLVVNLIFGPVFIVAGLFISAGILHLVLLAIAGGGRGFEATFRVVAYSQAGSVFNLVPLCGGLVTAVYTVVLLIIGLSEAHQITRGRAAAVVLVPLVVLCCCCGGAVAALIFGLAGALGQMR